MKRQMINLFRIASLLVALALPGQALAQSKWLPLSNTPAATLSLDFKNNYYNVAGFGKINPSLLSSFLNPGTTAQNGVTYATNADGSLTGYPAGHTNLAIQSVNFTSSWPTTNASLPVFSGSGPDGISGTAVQFTPLAINNFHVAGQSVGMLNGVYSGSAYFKQAPGGHLYGYIGLASNTAVYCNLQTGVFTSSGSTLANGSCLAENNGWWRISFTTTSLSSVSNNFEFGTAPAASNIYDGTGTTGSYVSRYQIEQGSISPYIPTTSAAVTAPYLRLGSGTGLLVEEARTNLVINSQDYTNSSWTPSTGFAATSITAAATTAPDGTPTGQLVADNATTAAANYGRQTATAFGISANTTYTQTTILKQRDYRYVQINLFTGTNRFGFFDLSNCSVTGTPSGIVSQTAAQMGGGWCRFVLVATSGAAETSAKATIIYCDTNTTSGHTGVVGTGTYFWGSQVELGAFPTSYIPTTTAAVTRNADNINAIGLLLSTLQGSSFSTIINSLAQPGSHNAAMMQWGVSGNGYSNNNGSSNSLAVYNLGFPSTLLGSGTWTTTPAKIASAQGGGTFSFVGNNGTVGTGSGQLNATASPIFIGSANGMNFLDAPIASITAFNQRLPDTILKALTQ